jgi:hypothetical protein
VGGFAKENILALFRERVDTRGTLLGNIRYTYRFENTVVQLLLRVFSIYTSANYTSGEKACFETPYATVTLEVTSYD